MWIPPSLSLFIVRWQRERRRVPLFFLFCCVPAHCWIVSCKGERENSLSLCVMAYTRRKGNAFVVRKRADFFYSFFICCPRCCCFHSNFKVKEIPVFECQPLTPQQQQLVCISRSSFRMGSNYINDKFFLFFFNFLVQGDCNQSLSLEKVVSLAGGNVVELILN